MNQRVNRSKMGENPIPDLFAPLAFPGQSWDVDIFDMHGRDFLCLVLRREVIEPIVFYLDHTQSRSQMTALLSSTDAARQRSENGGLTASRKTDDPKFHETTFLQNFCSTRPKPLTPNLGRNGS